MPLAVIHVVGVCWRRTSSATPFRRVIDRSRQRLELERPERTLRQREIRRDTRRARRAGDLGVAGEAPGQPAVAEQQRVELRDIDVFGVHAQRRIGAGDDAVRGDALVAVRQLRDS